MVRDGSQNVIKGKLFFSFVPKVFLLNPSSFMLVGSRVQSESLLVFFLFFLVYLVLYFLIVISDHDVRSVRTRVLSL